MRVGIAHSGWCGVPRSRPVFAWDDGVDGKEAVFESVEATADLPSAVARSGGFRCVEAIGLDLLRVLIPL